MTYTRLLQAAKILKQAERAAAVARLLNISEQLLTNWKSRGIPAEKITIIAKTLGCRPYWLEDGEGEMLENKNHVNQEHANYEIAPIGRTQGTVPIISWVKAGSFTECINDIGDYERIATDCEIREHTYALRVVGDSMVSDAAISFPAGIIIIVEPSMIAISGDFVIAINGDNEATFKQLIKDGVDWYLKPLNNRYPIKPIGSANVIGVIRQAVMKFK